MQLLRKLLGRVGIGKALVDRNIVISPEAIRRAAERKDNKLPVTDGFGGPVIGEADVVKIHEDGSLDIELVLKEKNRLLLEMRGRLSCSTTEKERDEKEQE